MSDNQERAKIINVKYRDKNLSSLVHLTDWIDTRVSAVTNMNVNSVDEILDMTRVNLNNTAINVAKGSEIKVWHGICLELPAGYEAIMCPRGSLFKKTGLIFTCSGVIDEGYKGNNDEWFSTFYATKDTVLHHDDRICQFRIQKKQPHLLFKTVENLDAKDRGGHGSTGGYKLNSAINK